MKAVIQRVRDASVSVEGKLKGEIKHGLLVYYSVEEKDTFDMIEPFLDKLAHLRIFEDEEGKMNLSLDKVSKEILWLRILREATARTSQMQRNLKKLRDSTQKG